MEELIAPMVDTVYPNTIEDKYNQSKRGYELLSAKKVRLLMETYTHHWEELIFKELVQLQENFNKNIRILGISMSSRKKSTKT